MVAYKAASVQRFLNAPDSRCRAVLLYGPDAGLVGERAAALAGVFAAGQGGAGEIVRLDDRDLAEDGARLEVELRTAPMFAARKVVRVAAGSRLDVPVLKALLEEPLDSALIVEAGNLRPDSGLRRLFEAQASAAALPCYGDERTVSGLIDYPEGLSSSADASLSLSGTMKSALLSGDIVINRLGVNQQFDLAAYLIKGLRGTRRRKSNRRSARVRLDVHVTSTPELQVQTTVTRLSGNLDLRLRGSAFRPVVLGRVDLLDGSVDFNGTKYRLERGDITFTNPVRIDPTLDMELTTRVRDYDLTLGFHGPIDRLNTHLPLRSAAVEQRHHLAAGAGPHDGRSRATRR